MASTEKKKLIKQIECSISKKNWGEVTRWSELLLPYSVDISPLLSNNIGNAHWHLKNYRKALLWYNQALAVDPDFLDSLNNKANALYQLGALKQAEQIYEKVLILKPTFFAAWNNAGNLKKEAGDFRSAEYFYKQALKLKPDYTDALNNLGIVKKNIFQYKEAIALLSRAIALRPDFSSAFRNRGNVKRDLLDHSGAADDYKKALALDPSYPFLLGDYIHTLCSFVHWKEIQALRDQLSEKLSRSESASSPFPLLSLIDDPRGQREIAEAYFSDRFPAYQEGQVTLKSQTKLTYFYKPGARIKLGYYSTDFHNHATAHLMASFFENHDRAVFETYAFSFGPAHDDEMKRRLQLAFDHFYEVSDKTDAQVAELSRSLGIDVAFDLKGYTQNSRPGIFAERCAPRQVNFLGYPGTLGTTAIDYIIADKVVIPEDCKQFYTEKVLYLPGCYQVNDDFRRVSPRVFRRGELGLPEQSVVFCCFNNNYKILPEMFDCWAEIIKAVPNSVLWLLKDNELVETNLRKEWRARNLEEGRLVFASRMSTPEHLARHRCADLFLDTYPCNAHTTASDALFMGLPVLTLMGKTFASRVAASLLNAIGLRDFIAETREAYVGKAINFARQGLNREIVQAKLRQAWSASSLSNSKAYAKEFENLIRGMLTEHP